MTTRECDSSQTAELGADRPRIPGRSAPRSRVETQSDQIGFRDARDFLLWCWPDVALTLGDVIDATGPRTVPLQVTASSDLAMRSSASCVDGNEAAARVAYAFSEVIPIYPITPSSPMAELADEWAAAARPNLWGAVPEIVEMQSEAGAAGTLHGALQKGAFATTFTSSQGLLLMVPNMFKIAGELTPCAMHVAARTVATHALSIFGDHSDVMHARTTGWAMLCAGSVQEAHDFAAVAHAATLRARVPFLHFFDGFRTSHEVDKITLLDTADLRALVDEEAVLAHRQRGLTPDAPMLRGSAQNPDVFFQAREAVNPFYDAVPGIVADVFEELAARCGRRYGLVDYVGAPDADRVIVVMGSGAGAAEEAVEALTALGERVGLLKVRLFRPFPAELFVRALPPTVRSIAVLDRTKEPGATGEPLLLDVIATLHDAMDTDAPPFERAPHVIGGRYGLSSKEFRPAHVKAVFDELARFDGPLMLGRAHSRPAGDRSGGSRWGSSTTSAASASTPTSRSRTSGRPVRCRRCSMDSAPTGRWGRTRHR